VLVARGVSKTLAIAIVAVVLVAAVAITAAVILSRPPAPVTTPRPQPVVIPQLKIGHNYEPDTLDLHATTWADITSALVYGTYLVRDWRDGTFLGYLAESWRFEEGGRVFVIRLKPGLRFADGTPINASVIKYTYERMKSKNAPTLAIFGKLERVEVVDELTAKLVFEEPYAPLLVVLTNSYQAPFNPSYIEKVGDVAYGRAPLAAGPFYVVEWKAGDYILYRQNPYYLRRPDVGGTGPVPVNEIYLKFIKDPVALVTALETGAVDLITTVSPELFPSLVAKNNTDIVVVTFPGIQLNYFGFNCIRWPFNDSRVRLAIAIILGGEDIRQALNEINNGLAYPVWGPLVPTIVGFDKAMEQYAKEKVYYNLPLSERIKIARELLKGAGWEDRDGDGILEYLDGTPFSFPLLVPREFYSTKEAEYLAYVLKQAGLEFKPLILDSVTIRDKYLLTAEHYVFLYVYGWQDALILRYLFHSTGVKRTWFSTPELDYILDKVASVVDPAERQEWINKAQKILIDEAPWVPLYAPLSVVAWRSVYTNIIINQYEGGTILLDLISLRVGG